MIKILLDILCGMGIIILILIFLVIIICILKSAKEIMCGKHKE